MKIVITLTIIFSISFLLIYRFIYSENKKETEEEKAGLFLVVFMSIFFAFIVAGVLGFFIFAIFGATSLVNTIFSLKISTNQLVILALSFFIYLFTLDNLIEIFVKYIMGDRMIYLVFLALIRIGIFYMIGDIVGLIQTVSMTIAIGVSLITLIIEVLYHLREKNKPKDIKG